MWHGDEDDCPVPPRYIKGDPNHSSGIILALAAIIGLVWMMAC